MPRQWTPAQKDGFRARLRQKRSELSRIENAMETEGLKGFNAEATGEVAGIHLHPADSGSDEATRNLSLKLASSEMEHLQEIEEALGRLDGDVYGECEECGVDIPEKRLEVLPEARYCVACEAELEDDAKNRQRPVDGSPYGNDIL